VHKFNSGQFTFHKTVYFNGAVLNYSPKSNDGLYMRDLTICENDGLTVMRMCLIGVNMSALLSEKNVRHTVVSL